MFYVTPPKNESEGVLKVVAVSEAKEFRNELIAIDYNHIPKQSVLMKSEAKVVRLNIQKAGSYIAYIKGAGDTVPDNLRQIGYTVVTVNPEDISFENMKRGVIAGSNLASFCVEKFGTERMENLTHNEIQERLLQFKLLTQFDIELG